MKKKICQAEALVGKEAPFLFSAFRSSWRHKRSRGSSLKKSSVKFKRCAKGKGRKQSRYHWSLETTKFCLTLLRWDHLFSYFFSAKNSVLVYIKIWQSPNWKNIRKIFAFRKRSLQNNFNLPTMLSFLMVSEQRPLATAKRQKGRNWKTEKECFNHSRLLLIFLRCYLCLFLLSCCKTGRKAGWVLSRAVYLSR